VAIAYAEPVAVREPISLGQIAARYLERKRAQDPLLGMARQIRDAFYGEIALPTSELRPNERHAVANMLQQALEQSAQRLRSVMPNLWCPPTRQGSQRAEKAAADRRRALLGMWKANRQRTLIGYRARHLLGYATSPVYIKPDFGRRLPRWHVRDPLTSFPAPTNGLGDMVPTDCIFCVQRTRAWLDRHYPGAGALLGRDPRPDDQFEILEFVDDAEIVLMVLGPAGDSNRLWTPAGGQGRRYVELERVANLAGCCPVVIPGRVGLDRSLGRYDGLLGLFYNKARLAALELIAIEEGVIPYQWFVVRQGEQFAVEVEADPREGIVGVVRGADLQTVALNPGYKTDQALDRIEREMRLEGRIPAEYGGESASNVRTDRRGNTIMSATIDYELAEDHDLLAESLEAENRIAVAVDKGYFADVDKPFYISMGGRSGGETYRPSKLWETDENVVKYPMPGTDLNNLILGIGQRLGLKTMSTDTALELDPMIDDPEAEQARIVASSLRMSLLSSLEQQSQAGAIPPADLARIASLVQLDDLSLFDAVTKAHEEAQQRQASSGPPGTPEGPVAAGSPEAQPGLAQPGMGAEAGTAIGPAPGTTGLADLMSKLRQGGRAA
jgi:hypothetical protein